MKSGYTREILPCPASQSNGFHFGKLPIVMQNAIKKGNDTENTEILGQTSKEI